jgi:hypothetical protein
MYARGVRNCPICRASNFIPVDDQLLIDKALENILIAYFPREIREKDQEELKEIYAALPQKQLSIEGHTTLSTQSAVPTVSSSTHTPSTWRKLRKRERCNLV